MTKTDTEDLWRLLAKLRPKDPHLDDNALKEAWFIVLRPYKPADVGKAVGAYFREKKFWPDPTEIAKMCPKPEAKKETAHAADRPWPGWPAYGYRDADDYRTQMRAIITQAREGAP